MLLNEVGVLDQLVTKGVEEGGLQSAEAIVIACNVRLTEGEGLGVT